MINNKVGVCGLAARDNLRGSKKEFNITEDDLKSLQSVAQIIGEVLRPLDNERLIVKASSGPRYVVGCRSKVDKEKLISGTRFVLDMTTLTIMRALPREVRSLHLILSASHFHPSHPFHHPSTRETKKKNNINVIHIKRKRKNCVYSEFEYKYG
ncbi:26S proteasome regulatory subunit 10B homolog A [Brassica rapa]|uniref:26S proteasome regulatory subunit 10B homolog A n=1 Tax=Brassica campestris TaxID=3711 RepID=UPI0004F14F81|nr:26S proteasome regulatory subunit 10B homolog A [Brassica rapa]